jgi:putative transposase
MSYKKPIFSTGEIYHIYNRGVEKRTIFLDASDYFRMTRNLYDFNDKNVVSHPYYHPKRNPVREKKNPPREPLVEILAFVLMPNHYHLALRQIEENGIIKFMQKLDVGYAMYFNKKRDRVGSLFQGRFKATHIDSENYMCNLLGYIHTNPADLVKNYRDRISETIDFLEKYRWSSFLDYIGIENFPAVTSRDFLTEVIGDSDGIKASANAWVAHREKQRETVPEIIEVVSRERS